MSSSTASAVPGLNWHPSDLQGGARPVRHSKLDFALVAVTLARLSLVPIILLSFMRFPAITIWAIVLFVVFDIFDGVFARARNADGPQRRALDSAVDRIGIDAGIVGAYIAGILPAFLLAALLIRDAYCAAICARMMYRRRVAIKADWVYRTLNLTVAAGAISAPFISQRIWVPMAGFMFIFAIVVAVDLTRLVSFVERSPRDLRTTVVSATALRRMLSS